MAEVTMPQLGESVTEGTITKWFKQVGEHVDVDEPLFEVSTDKVDSEVPSPEAGYIAEIKVPEGETVDVGTVLVVLSDQADGGAPADDAPRPRRRAGGRTLPPSRSREPTAAQPEPRPAPEPRARPARDRLPRSRPRPLPQQPAAPAAAPAPAPATIRCRTRRTRVGCCRPSSAS